MLSVGSDNTSTSAPLPDSDTPVSSSLPSPPPPSQPLRQAVLAQHPIQHQQPHVQHYHHQPYRYDDHYQQHQVLSYSPTLGTPTSPLGYISTSPPPQMSPQPMSPVAAPGGFALVGGQMVHGGSPPQPYAYYAPIGGSPAGSPQMAPLMAGASPSSALAAHFVTAPITQMSHSPGVGGHAMPKNEMLPGAHHSPPLPLHQPSQIVHSPTMTAAYGDATVSAVDSRNVYIRNLTEDCTDEALVRMASPFGEIESSKSIIQESTGKCKGYGFVKYRTEEQAASAIEAFNAKGLHSTLAKDSFKSKLKRLQDRNSANIYVSNLPPDIDEEQLVEIIKPYPVVSARILRDSLTGQHKGAGFARMVDRETALLVIERLKGLRLPNAPGPLIPRIADSEGQKQLKKQINGEQSQSLDEGSIFVRSGATSPLMWSPVLVYSPAASPPLTASGVFDQMQQLPEGADQGRRIPSPQNDRYSTQHQQVMSGTGVYALPTHYAGYTSMGFGLSSSYVSPPGYVSPQMHMPASPQQAIHAQLPDQPHIPQTAEQRRRSKNHDTRKPSEPTTEHTANDLAGAMQDKLAI
ncbi:hypothetical protein COEREDRAFT_83030 [Coemansia reversa NRRL 1564]|uniref:RRM domain-containing protein n=1 Tax=Coemansia reversa (strain ATCC 12441 / NRRL 1564) TaxID=763665 RepID=A0A2G5B4W7_COERN|nr:hypothetical protein COEREDRAFT_83030 [Coemansia reversa NRRL 1564]|eukprot:PIA14093.1 hypothetical protein COEREDRAFT_83030 [Coemansia reversa NRRL 1564]